MLSVYKGRRKGMKTIEWNWPERWRGGEIITNAYGSGYVNKRPEIIPPHEWDEMVLEAKRLEADDNA